MKTTYDIRANRWIGENDCVSVNNLGFWKMLLYVARLAAGYDCVRVYPVRKRGG